MKKNRLNWNWFRRILIILLLLITIFSILTGKNITYCKGKSTFTPTPQVTPQITPLGNSQDAILQAAQMAISTSQTAMSSIQTTVNIITMIVALFGVCNLATIIIYLNKIRDIKIFKKELQEIKQEAEKQNSNVQILEEELVEKRTTLETFFKDLGDLSIEITQITKNQRVFSAITQLRNKNSNIRLKNLRTLSESVHPDGVIPMIEILTNNQEQLTIRKEAAKGLGRYSENRDLDDYWEQIFDSFKNVLENDNSLHELIGEIMESTAKYKSDARELFSLIVKWSKNDDTQLQQTFIVSFGKADIYDDIIVDRLKEMGFNRDE